jgi:hypothetical protein
MSNVDWNTYVEAASEKVSQYKTKQDSNVTVNSKSEDLMELQDRIRRLEEDMAHVLVNK